MFKRGNEDKNHNDEDVKSYTVCVCGSLLLRHIVLVNVLILLFVIVVTFVIVIRQYLLISLFLLSLCRWLFSLLVLQFLLCIFFFVQVLNELLIDRGSAQSLSNLDVYCNDRLITSVQGDGMLQAVYLKTNF